MVSDKDSSGEFDEVSEVTLELDILAPERHAVKVEAIEAAGSVTSAADIARYSVHAVGAVPGRTIDKKIETVSAASHVENIE